LIIVGEGADKTTVSVGTGHQEFHPLYQLLGNITNAAHRGHRNGIKHVALLLIPKGMLSISLKF